MFGCIWVYYKQGIKWDYIAQNKESDDQGDIIVLVIILTDDAWVSGMIGTAGDVHYYSVTTNQSGWLTLAYQGFSIQHSYFIVKNYDMTKTYVDKLVWDSSAINPITYSETLALEPGTYIIIIKGNSNDRIGDYRVKASFKPANNNENSNNHDFATAQPLSFGNSVNGFLSQDATTDFYQFTLTSSQMVRVLYTSDLRYSYITIYNKDFLTVFTKDVNYADESNPITYEFSDTFEPGTYYIKIYPSFNSTGRYTLNLQNSSIPIIAQSLSISGKSKVTAGKKVQLYASVAPANVSNGSVRWTSGDPYIASVNEKSGLVTTYRPGVVNITATTLDGSNISKVYKIIVTPKKMSAPKLKTGKSGQIKVSFSRQTGAKGYQIQYGTNSKYKSAKSKKTSSVNITLKSLKRKKTYYVRVRSYIKQGSKTYYGDWSKSKKIKVK